MIMIIGGAYQGKLTYAKNHIGKFEMDRWAEGEELSSVRDLKNLQGIHGLHKLIWKEMEKKRDDNPEMSILDWESWANELAQEIIEANPKLLIITDELGYGIVPMDKKERDFREVTGRVCTRLAAFSCEVHRVICGIGTRIK